MIWLPGSWAHWLLQCRNVTDWGIPSIRWMWMHWEQRLQSCFWLFYYYYFLTIGPPLRPFLLHWPRESSRFYFKHSRRYGWIYFGIIVVVDKWKVGRGIKTKVSRKSNSAVLAGFFLCWCSLWIHRNEFDPLKAAFIEQQATMEWKTMPDYAVLCRHSELNVE